MTGTSHVSAGCAAVFLTVSSAAFAQDPTDYRLESEAWNGLAGVRIIADEIDVELLAPSEISLDELRPLDSLVIVSPRHALPVDAIADFLALGGRVAILDDFGSGDELFAAYGIAREEVTGDSALFRGNPNLPVARAVADHPLSAGARALVANHAQALTHPSLTPIFAFQDGGGGLVVTGAIDEGRLVAISDASILINNMLQFRGNAIFARNLLTYLSAERGGRVFVATPRTVLRAGPADEPPRAPLANLAKWFEEIARADAPPLALQIGAFIVALLLVIVAVSSLPRKSPYASNVMFPEAAPAGGFVGRVSFFRDRPSRLIHPALVYKFELEGELTRRLGLRGRVLLRDVIAGLRATRLSAAEVEELRALLIELADLEQRQDHPPSPPRVSRSRLHRIVSTGDRLLGKLE